jgi:armadillo repeat-containing protein 2
VFKFARNENNDGLFLEHDVPELLIDGLGRASPHDDPEACIYGYGAIRFLANSAISTNRNSSFKSLVEEKITKVQQKQKSLAYRLARHGAVQLMILHLQMLNEAGSTTKLCGQPLHVLFQLSGALRSLAGVPAMAEIMKMPRSVLHKNSNIKYPQIRETQEAEDIRLELAGPHLVKAAEICIDEPDVQGNLIRTLSILSESEQCCEYLADTAARLGILLGPVGGTNGIPEKSLAVLNRLGYILGNIMSRFDIARLQYYDNDVAMEYLLNTLVYYSTQTLNKSTQKGDTVADVLIKLVRVIANMSVNSHVGYGLGAKSPLGAALLNILLLSKDAKVRFLTFCQLIARTKVFPLFPQTTEMEELLLATLGALHNLSYYQESSEMSQPIYQAGSMIERIKDISSTLCAVLNGDVAVAKAEAARVLGNLTRNYTARQAFCSVGGLRAIVRCLASDDFELIATSCGVLVNILSDWERRVPFRELKGPQMLREVLEKSVLQEDWILSAIAGQAMWNYLIDSDNIIGVLGETETDNLAGILVEYLGEIDSF